MHTVVDEQEATEGCDVPPEREWLTVDQVADYLQVHPETVRKWLRAGDMVGVNLGGVAGWRIRREDVERFIDSRRSK